ncbi:MAG: hypothetical protein IPJ34_22055 [Myxococcales bacterium]|nr:hypothetical protein [Myxococcales bacterium]
MPSLSDALLNEDKKATVIADCCTLIDEEVASKSGISGLAIKAGYGAVKGIKPGFVKQVVTDLLPEFAKALEPIWLEAKEASKPVVAHYEANAPRAADALLAITDAKAKVSKSGVVKGTYEKLRPTAKKHVEAAVPRLARLVDKHGG